MNNKIYNYFRLAGKAAEKDMTNKSFLLGAVGIRGDGTIVSATNSISQVPNRMLHAEKRLCNKLDYGATVYVARVRLLNGEYALSRPCPDCYKALKYKNVSRCYYTVSETEWGVIDFD
jgi:tRNA(Arg) A34 adenosine deaminase TadA